MRYIGCSNFAGRQVADAAWTSETKGLEHFVSAQNRYSLLERGLEQEVAPAPSRTPAVRAGWQPTPEDLVALNEMSRPRD